MPRILRSTLTPFLAFLALYLVATTVKAQVAPFTQDYRYEGSYDDLKRPHGKGKMTFSNGDVYEGDLVHGMAKGKGIYRARGAFDGDLFAYHYQGEFVASTFEGQGEITWANGTIYRGNFYRNRYHGQGDLQDSASKSRYTGEWQEGIRAGQGRFITPDYTYEGSFKNNEPEGPGRILFNNGSTLESEFVRGNPSRFVTLTYTNGTVIKGDFHAGEINGQGEILHADGSHYQGDVRFNMHNGKGLLTVPGEYVYEGQFVEGKFHGQGKMTMNNGNAYAGSFWRGRMHGHGRLSSNGWIYDGEFGLDKPHGKGLCNDSPCEFIEGNRIN